MSPDYRRPINAGAGSDADALLKNGADAVDPAQLLKEHNAKTAKLVAAVKKANPLTWRNVFDPARNVSALLEQSPARTLGGLDSLKTLSMFQIILVHSGLLTLLVGQQTSNSYLNFIAMFRSQFLISTDKAVDTFFLISGLLMAYTTINKLRKGRQSLGGAVGKTGLFTMLRFFRLVPLYGVVLMFYATILPHMGSGPIWYKMIEETGRCRQNWWTNLLFINNFHPTAFHDTCTDDLLPTSVLFLGFRVVVGGGGSCSDSRCYCCFGVLEKKKRDFAIALRNPLRRALQPIAMKGSIGLFRSFSLSLARAISLL